MEGSVSYWVDELTRFAVDLGTDAFIFWPAAEPTTKLRRFAEEVAPEGRGAGIRDLCAIKSDEPRPCFRRPASVRLPDLYVRIRTDLVNDRVIPCQVTTKQFACHLMLVAGLIRQTARVTTPSCPYGLLTRDRS